MTDERIKQIVQIIDDWKGPLTWQLLVDEVEKYLGVKYSRQTLYKYTRIKNAYQDRKATTQENEGVPVEMGTKTAQRSAETIKALRRKVERLEKENDQLLEQFVRWAYNARSATHAPLTEDDLNKPLPDVDRGATEL
jgi:predicted nuclease with TOPRIM domain